MLGFTFRTYVDIYIGFGLTIFVLLESVLSISSLTLACRPSKRRSRKSRMRDKSTDPGTLKSETEFWSWPWATFLVHLFQGGTRETKVEYGGVPENLEKTRGASFRLSLCPDSPVPNLSRSWRFDSQSEGLARRKKKSV